MPALQLEGLVRRYGEREALGGVSLTLEAGQSLVVFGPNGAGKSTLLRVLATLLRPHRGSVRVLGRSLPGEAWAVRGHVGLLAHEPLLYRDLSARENLRFYARLHAVGLARVEELLELGFGSCRLEAAVPEESGYQTVDDLAGATIATVYPRLARELLTGDVELVDVTGSVEIAPRLGLADGIVDLVSSGNTLRTNGLRSLGALFSSQAVLIGKPGADANQLVSMMRAVVEARAHRYLMLNTPEPALDAVCDIIGSRSPSVLPLAEPGMVAVHALVPSKDVWRLLPELEAVGASSILVVPVERMTR